MSEPNSTAAALCVSCVSRPATCGKVCAVCRQRAIDLAASMAPKVEPAAPAKPKYTAPTVVTDLAPAHPGDPPPAERARIRVRANVPRTATAGEPSKCCQCNRELVNPPESGDTTLRCGKCVRANGADLRSFMNRPR